MTLIFALERRLIRRPSLPLPITLILAVVVEMGVELVAKVVADTELDVAETFPAASYAETLYL